MVALDAMVVTTALSAIRVSLGASLESLEWTVNAYNLSFAVLLLTGTALGDRFGRRRLFCYGIGLFAGGSAACGLATSVGWLIVARALQGAGAALVVPLAMALLGAAFSREGFRQNSCRLGQLFCVRVAHDEAIMMRAMRLP
jgi:MFS family permease